MKSLKSNLHVKVKWSYDIALLSFLTLPFNLSLLMLSQPMPWQCLLSCLRMLTLPQTTSLGWGKIWWSTLYQDMSPSLHSPAIPSYIFNRALYLCQKQSKEFKNFGGVPQPWLLVSSPCFRGLICGGEEAKLWRITRRYFPFDFRTAKRLHILSLANFLF